MLKITDYRILALTVCMLLGTLALSQDINNDSLFNIWKDKSKDKRTRVEAFIERFDTDDYITEKQFYEWLEESEKALKFSKRIKEEKYEGFFNLLVGFRYREQLEKEEQSCKYFERGIELLLKHEYDRHIMMFFWRRPFGCESLSEVRLKEIMSTLEQRLKVEQRVLFHVTSGFYLIQLPDQKERACEAFKTGVNYGLEDGKYDMASIGLIMLKTGGCTNYSVEAMDSKIGTIEREIQKEVNDLNEIRSITSTILNYYDSSDMYPDALRTAQKIIKYSEQLQEYDWTYANAIYSIGSIHNQIGNYEDSEKYLLKSQALADSLQDYNLLGASYISLSKLYVNKKDADKASVYIKKGLEVMKDKKHCEPCYLIARVTRASIENMKGNYKEALEELIEVKNSLIMKGGYENQYGNIYSEMSKAYIGLGEYPKAIEYANLGLSDNIPKNLSDQFDLHEVMYTAQDRAGYYKSSFDNFRKMVAIKDSLEILRNSEEVTRLELEKKFAEERLADSLRVAQDNIAKELQFQNEISKQKTTRNILIALGVGLLIFLLALYSRLRYIKRTEMLLKKKNELIKAEKEKALASERAKHQFLANMSHEIRTPMNAIKGMTEILLRRDPNEEQVEFLSGIKQSSDALLVIINDILDLSKIESGKIELENIQFDLDEILQGVHTIMKFKAEEKGLELNIKDSGLENALLGDPSRLRQILINLVGNAIKFTEKGIVNVMVEQLESHDEEVLLQFTVSDTGVGIAREHLEKIFNSFEQEYADTSRKFGGTGLGLSISKKLVELYNGKIWVESEKGKGSQFHFSIAFKKASELEQVHKAQKGTVFDKSLLKGIKILLVEDNDFNAVVAQEELEDAIEDVGIELAENGSIAIEKLKSDNFDIVLMDVQMPVMNGYEATQKIRTLPEKFSEIPIIAMTANVLKDEIERCYASGMDDFIGKPFNTEMLIQKIYRHHVGIS